MTARRLMLLGAAASTLSMAATPALGHHGRHGPDMTYEYAQPAPSMDTEVVYHQHPVVQPIPAHEERPGADYDVEYEYETLALAHHGSHNAPHPVHHAPHARMPAHHGQVAAHPHYGHYGYGYAIPAMYVPVRITVPQRAIVRETVTEEWVEEEVRSYRRPVPRPTKRQPVKRVKYRK